MKGTPVRVGGSFRHPRGHVVLHEGRLLRCLSKAGADNFQAVGATRLLNRLVADGGLLPWSAGRAVSSERFSGLLAQTTKGDDLRKRDRSRI